MKRLVAIAVIVVLPVLVAGCSGAGATPITVSVTPAPAASAAAEPPVSTPAPAVDQAASLGQAVTITNTADNSHVGDVTVLASKKYPQGADYQTPKAGDIFLAVEVRYAAAAAMSYNPLDWIVRDANGNQFEANVWMPGSYLDAGNLGAGRKRTGWVGFEVPKSGHMWVDFINGDGSTIFEVKLY